MHALTVVATAEKALRHFIMSIFVVMLMMYISVTVAGASMRWLITQGRGEGTAVRIRTSEPGRFHDGSQNSRS